MKDIKLADDPAENIVNMASYLSEKQQYVVLGMFLAQNQKFYEKSQEKKEQSNQNKAEL